MLGFMSDSGKQGKKINIVKLKKEINDLSRELIFLKKKIRDPKLNFAVEKGKLPNQRSDFYAALNKQIKTKLRFNKLVVLRSLMRNKMHFHKNTRISHVDYKLKGLTVECLWDWVEDIRKEFE